MAYTNLNQDYSLDLITFSEDSLHLLVYNPTNHTFADSLVLPSASSRVLAADYNLDGFNDVMWVGRDFVEIAYLDGCAKDGCRQLDRARVQFLAEVLQVGVVDPVGGRVPHLLVSLSDNSTTIFSPQTRTTYTAMPSLLPLTHPSPIQHFSQLDIDGDCASDLVLLQPEGLSFYSRNKDGF